MIRNWTLIKVLALAAILFTACTQDELAEQGNTLPEGEYPLQIGSVSITAESSEEPWTRVAENETDGMGSHWTGGERIGVRIAGSEETGIYIINVDDAGNVTVEPETPVYWKSTQTAEVTAWYPAEASGVNLEFQYLNGLTYVLRGTGTGSYQSPVTLKFEHQLAKLRVVAKGTAEVRDISIWNVPRICYIDEGKITGLDDISTGDIQMLPVEREGIGACWEASVGPGMEIKAFRITVPVDGMSGTYYGEWGSTVTPEAGKLSTITLAVHRKDTKTIDLSNSDYEINGDGTYYFSGTASHAIRVTGGKPNIYLEDAQINVSNGNAIDITGGNPTIHVMGENTIANNSFYTDGAGIYVAQGSTVTITGRDRNDVLTAQAGGDAAGIGGCSNNQNCGSINISNVTVIARSSNLSYCSPGIGSTQTYQCGDITIDNATVHAYGTEMPNTCGSPGIGAGLDISGSTGTTPPNVTIRNNSEVHTHRGNSYADYIGLSYFMTSGDGLVRATVDASSVVYKYTGDGNTPDQ